MEENDSRLMLGVAPSGPALSQRQRCGDGQCYTTESANRLSALSAPTIESHTPIEQKKHSLYGPNVISSHTKPWLL